jgi:EAL domain-containing protein (putative c-di-GMP-specific phosphodiesterase class I)
LTARVLDMLVDDIAMFEASNVYITISINVTNHDLQSSRFFNKLIAYIDDGSIKPELLQLELVESSLINLTEFARLNLMRLHTIGVMIALDDFGAGFSSFDIISSFPISILKIDRSLVAGLDRNDKLYKLFTSIVRMAHSIDLRTVAEGPENNDEFVKILYSGCKQMQGFIIAKPMEISQAIKMYKDKNKWPSNSMGLIHQAQLDHILWRKSLLEAIFLIKQNLPVSADVLKQLTQDHTTCNFGLWYHKDGKLAYGEFTEFKDINVNHELFHKLGREIMDSILIDASKDLDTLLSKFNNVSLKIIKSLMDLEDRIHLTT